MSERLPGPAPFLSVVVPVYNEVAGVAPLAEALYAVLPGIGRTFEVILVDDGSTDGTLDKLRAEKARRAGLRVIRLVQNCGQSAAMAAGFAAARGEVVVTLDADLQNDPGDIPALLARLDAGDCDVVCGWRQRRQDSWLRLVSSRIANGVRNRLSGESIVDTGCSLKAYRTEFLRRIKMYKGMHRFLPTLLKMEGARAVEIPVRHHPRVTGTSKYGVWNRLFKGLADLFAVRWMKKRHIAYRAEELE